MNKFHNLLIHPALVPFALVFFNLIVLGSFLINFFVVDVNFFVQIFPSNLSLWQVALKFAPTGFVALVLLALLYFLIKCIRKQVLESERMKFRRFTGTLCDILWVQDIKTRKSPYVSDACRRYTGYTSEEYCAMTMEEKFTPETCQKATSALAGIIDKLNAGSKTEDVTFEGQQYTRWGSTNWVEISAVIAKDKNGNFNEAYGITRMINDRKKLELQLKESEEKHRFIAQNIKDLIVVSDYNTLRYTYVSNASLQVLGYTPEEMIGKQWIEFAAPAYYSDLMAHLYDPVESYHKGNTGALHAQFETQKIHKNGSLVWVEISGNILLDSHNNPKTVITTLRRIDDRKQIELQIIKQKEELAIANKTKERFFSIISHDLKNPISSLHQMGEMLTTDFAAVSASSKNSESKELLELKDDINLLNEAAEQAYKLLVTLLDWARCSMDSISYKPKQQNLLETIDKCCKHLTAQASVKNITIETHCSNKEIFANYDENLILTVARNLISNAIKFSFNGSVVNVKVSDFAKNNNYIVVSVSDAGTGMTEEIMGKLFKVDEKIMSVGTNGEPGTGLGLILCKEFIGKHSGDIWVESKEGNGSTFFFTLQKECL